MTGARLFAFHAQEQADGMTSIPKPLWRTSAGCRRPFPSVRLIRVELETRRHETACFAKRYARGELQAGKA